MEGVTVDLECPRISNQAALTQSLEDGSSPRRQCAEQRYEMGRLLSRTMALGKNWINVKTWTTSDRVVLEVPTCLDCLHQWDHCSSS